MRTHKYGESSAKYYAENRERILREKREYYVANHAKLQARLAHAQTAGMEWINSHKVHCEHCFTADNLEFHHVDPANKAHDLSRMTTHSKAGIRLEMNKCLVLCMECHKKIHSKSVEK